MATFLKPGSVKFPENIKLSPIDYFLNKITEMRSNPKPSNKVIIVQGETGSGKSTVMPVNLTKNFPEKLIISVQPRVFNTIEIPTVSIQSLYKDMKLGINMGYKTGPSKVLIERGLMFMTFGSFKMYLGALKKDEIFAKISFVIIDEAHDSSLHSEIVHFMLKKFIKENGSEVNCPIFIITSATIDIKKLMKFYETDNFMYVEGAEIKRNETYLNYNSDDVYKNTVDAVKYIISQKDKPPFNDILIFLSGVSELKDVEFVLKNSIPKLVIVNISRESILVDENEKEKINIPVTKLGGQNKIILITNVGETGITYKYLKYVIDFGFEKSAEYDSIKNIYSLIRKPITKMSLIQRAGRIGRIFKGDYIGLFSSETKDKLHFFPVPEIYKSDISIELLNFLKLVPEKNYKNLFSMDLLNKPSPEILWKAIEKLYLHGFLNSKYEITISGEIAVNLVECNTEQTKLILAGFFWKAPIYDIMIIAYFLRNPKKTKHESLFTSSSCCDFLTNLEDYYLNGNDDVSNFHDKCLMSMTSIGLNPYKNIEKRYGSVYFKANMDKYIRVIKKCIYEALKLNIAFFNGKVYETREEVKLYKIPSKVVNYSVTKHFVFSRLKLSFNIGRRQISPVGVSVMDGFCGVVDEFY